MEFFLTYIVPVLILIALAFIFGFALEFFGKKLIIEKDPLIDEVTSKLSGANCGGCGFPGCAAFAEALVKGEAELSACNPTEKKSKDEIAVLLGKESTGVETVAIVNCNGGNNCVDKYSYRGYGTCTTAELVAGGNKACYKGCMCLGTCSDACKYEAIRANTDKGYAEVIADKCTSCGACVTACPKKLITRIPKDAKIQVACSNRQKGREVSMVCKTGCIACGICQKTCKYDAIKVIDNLAVVDYEKCTGCLDCVNKCPTKVIKNLQKQ